MLLDNIALFQLIVEKGSLVAAGRENNISATTVSERLAALESHYGVRLLNRTTRSISLTEEGRTLLEGSKALLDRVEELDIQIRHGAETVAGLIRISTPIDMGRTRISQALDSFLVQHPQVTLEHRLSDGFVDLIGEGCDMAIRFGTPTDSSLRLRRVGEMQRVVCAAPAYLEKHGVPQTPHDLKSHNCLIMRFGSDPDNVWRFYSGTQEQKIVVHGNRITNDGALVRQWALDGHGIILKSELDVAADLQEGRLIAVLRKFSPPPLPLQLMFPPGRNHSRRVEKLASHLIIALRNIDQV
ncbi:LysR family transcriptional regulator [Epibacterium ulvae]|uniref:LysR family transcriptional regulator n=1 Tax=Epibacterium ulvae TaxID=1156985 RepID=UPI0024925339|nr:LysR family transcriptional regulator [Epibacterium ulvae]